MRRLVPLLSIFLFSLGYLIPSENVNAGQADERVWVHAQFADQYLGKGRLESAKDRAEFVLVLDSDDSNANHFMIFIEARLGNIRKPGSLFAKLVEIDSENGITQNNYDSFLCVQKMWMEGIFQYNSAMENPFSTKVSRSVLGLGHCYAGMGDLDNAKLYLKRALQENPNLKTGLYHTTALSYRKSRHMAARAFIERHLDDGSVSTAILFLAVRNEIRLDLCQLAGGYTNLLEGGFSFAKEAEVIANIMRKLNYG